MCVCCCPAQQPQVAAHRVGTTLHTILHQPIMTAVMITTGIMCIPHTRLGQDAFIIPTLIGITQCARTQPMNGHRGSIGEPVPRWMASG